MLVWNVRRFFTNNYFLLIGIAFLFVGFIDIIHTFAYKGMGIFKGYDSNLPTQLWIAARYVQSITFLVAPLFIMRKLKVGQAFLAYSLTVFLLLFVIFYRIFPDCFIEGQGLTAFKVTSEYVISAVLATSLVFLYQKRTFFDPFILKLLTASTIAVIASEMSFTLYRDVYGFFNMLGHVLKIVAFYLIYKAIIVTGLDRPYGMLFRDLKIERDRAQKYLDLAGVMFVAIDAEQKVTLINRRGCEVLGYDEHEVVGKNWFDTFLPERLRDIVRADFFRLMAGEVRAVAFYENPVLTKSGDERLIAWHTIVFFDENGHVTGTLGSGEDITDRKKAEERLSNEKNKFLTLTEGAPFGVAMIDKEGQFIYINPKFKELFGYDREDVPDGRTWFKKAYPDPEYRKTAIAAWVEDLKRAEAGQIRPRIFKVRCKDDTEKIINFIPVQLKTGENMMSCDDITEQKRLEQQLHTMSLTDELTGLYNRRGFITLSGQQLKIAERTKKGMLLFFADLDRMKDINDTLGHQAGDMALVEVAAIFKEVFRESDIIGRIGGDEFAVLAIDAADEAWEILTDRLQKTLDNYNRPEGRSYTLSLSIGTVHYNPERPCSLDELMAQADTLMYEKKRTKQH